jgi:gamma-glutamylputrescine oxidase
MLRDRTYYDDSVQARDPTPGLAGELATDVCVIGAGIAGCSAALNLAERGFRVVLLEADRIGAGASGRSGGQVLPGFASEQTVLERLLGNEDARRMWDISVEAIALLRERITRHSIECDWRDGQLQVAIKPRHRDALAAWQDELTRKYAYEYTRFMETAEIHSILATDRYRAGLYDTNAGHLNPLKYTLGLADAARAAGVAIFEQTPVIGLEKNEPVVVRSPNGRVRARYMVLCGNALLGNLVPQLYRRIMPVKTYVIATQPLGRERAIALIRNDCGVTDLNFILDYFRRSSDNRLLFGGRVSYSGRDTLDTARATRARMLQVFPQLADVRIDYAWGGLLDITMSRAPDFGRIAPTCYYLQGFSGHGVALAGMAGKLAADAIGGQAERFDLFAKITHRDFPGGSLLRTPALVLAMLWYRLRDLL